MDIFNPKLKKYQKKFDFTYSFGIYPTLELLKNKREMVLKIVLKDGAERFEGVSEILEICKREGVRFEYNDRQVGKISYKENTYVVGIFKKYECDISKESNHLVLVEPRNMGNMGTIIRSMVGFDFEDLVIVGNGADIFDPKVVSSTVGAIFKVNFKYFNNIEEYTKEYSNHTLYPFMLDGKKSVTEVEFKEPFSIIQGNENEGLPTEYSSIGESVYIPHSKDIESLNLSVATSIAMWEFRSRNGIIAQE